MVKVDINDESVFWYALPGTFSVFEVAIDKFAEENDKTYSNGNTIHISAIDDMFKPYSGSVFKKQLFKSKIEAEIYASFRMIQILKFLGSDSILFDKENLSKKALEHMALFEKEFPELVLCCMGAFDFSLLI